MGEKGSLKNLYKDFKLRLYYRIKKKKEEEELIRRINRKYKLSSKDKFKLSFSIILGAIFYSFFSIFSKTEEVEIKVIEKEKDLKEVKKAIKKVKKEATKSVSSVQIKKCEDKINQIDNAVSDSKYVSKKIEELKEEVVFCKAYIEVKKENIVKEEKKVENVNETLKEIKEIIKESTEKVETININKSKEENIKKLDEIKKEIEKIEERIKENKILEEDLEKIDKFLLLSNDEELKKLKAKIESKLALVNQKEETPKELSKKENKKNFEKKQEKIKKNSTELPKKETKKELKNKKEEIKEVKEKTKEKIDENLKQDLISFNKIISKEVLISRKKVIELRKNVRSRKSLLGRLTFFSKTAISFCVSLSPLFFFRNKTMGTLTSAILLNNSIRNMRMASGVNGLSYYDHISINQMIKEHNDIEIKTAECFNDAYEQIKNFRNELDLNFYDFRHTNEYKEIVMDIENIEKYIKEKQKQYKKENEKIKILLKNY